MLIHYLLVYVCQYVFSTPNFVIFVKVLRVL